MLNININIKGIYLSSIKLIVLLTPILTEIVTRSVIFTEKLINQFPYEKSRLYTFV